MINSSRLILYTILLSSISLCFGFDCPSPDGYFKDPANPHKYYECSVGKAYSFDCPASLVWNDVAKACDYDNAATNPTVSTVSGATGVTSAATTAAVKTTDTATYTPEPGTRERHTSTVSHLFR